MENLTIKEISLIKAILWIRRDELIKRTKKCNSSLNDMVDDEIELEQLNLILDKICR